MKLSKRLKLVADMIPSNIPCADIGSDHGLLVKYLIENNIIPFAYASDNKVGPYNRLISNLKQYIDSGRLEVNLKDGIEDLPPKYKTVVIAGMGGELITKIIYSQKDILRNIDYFLLAPQGNEVAVRECLINLGYMIVDENIVFENHYYEVILFKKGKCKYSTKELTYGPINLCKKTDIFIAKYQNKISFNLNILQRYKLSKSRKNQILKEIKKDRAMLENL